MDLTPLARRGPGIRLYLQTLAPGIEFGDAGELVTAAARLWVPHPSGNLLFLLLGHLFAKLPVGSEEFVRLNLMSALLCALGLGLGGAQRAALGAWARAKFDRKATLLVLEHGRFEDGAWQSLQLPGVIGGIAFARC